MKDTDPEASIHTVSYPRPATDAVAVRPDVSVIIPVFNAEPWLDGCLSSVLRQPDVSLEVICVNDGSTDSSGRILRKYADRDDRVIIIERPNGGLSAARNDGLAVASGRYTVFLDSDDRWRTEGLSELVALCDRDELDVLMFDAKTMYESAELEATRKSLATYYERKRSYSTPCPGVQLMSTLLRAQVYRASACLYLTRTDLINEHGLRFIPGIAHEDNPFTFALLLTARRAAHEKNAFYERRVRAGSIMTAGSAERSLRGYFASYLDMNRRCVRHDIPEEYVADIGRLLQEMYLLARRFFLAVSEEEGTRLRDAADQPDAFVTYLMLRRDRNRTVELQQARGETSHSR